MLFIAIGVAVALVAADLYEVSARRSRNTGLETQSASRRSSAIAGLSTALRK